MTASVEWIVHGVLRASLGLSVSALLLMLLVRVLRLVIRTGQGRTGQGPAGQPDQRHQRTADKQARSRAAQCPGKRGRAQQVDEHRGRPSTTP